MNITEEESKTLSLLGFFNIRQTVVSYRSPRAGKSLTYHEVTFV